jgi:two-component system, OmpR family, sensor kinase
MRHAFASLTSRLVLTAVALVVLVAVLIGVAATAALHAQLTDQLDDDLRAAAGPVPTGGLPPGIPPSGDRPDFDRRGGPETLAALIGESVRQGFLFEARGEQTALSDKVLDQLADIPVDGQVHQVDLSGLGTYRLIAREADQGTDLTGLPTDPVDESVSSLVQWEILLITLGAVVAVAAGLLLVRRQLRPLREVAATAHTVAELPLASGEIELSERVPERLTDERTEVGQVGAALNTLLSHVEASLGARQRSEAQVRQFVADASHELRTPLSTIQGYAELAGRRPDDVEGVRASLAKMESASHRMADLVEDLLLLARLDSGRPLAREAVDLTRLALEAVADARMLAPDHHWRLDLPDEPIEVPGDEQRLHQVVTNLLTNARTHTPAGTVVTVSVRPGEVRVHDDGPGFPPGLVDRAFERFTRGDDARIRGGDSGGAGLGLSLVEAIVAAHGGAVSLDSKPGDTTLTVRLPV